MDERWLTLSARQPSPDATPSMSEPRHAVEPGPAADPPRGRLSPPLANRRQHTSPQPRQAIRPRFRSPAPVVVGLIRAHDGSYILLTEQTAVSRLSMIRQP